MAAIELHGLTKRFGAVTAVDDVTLELEAGTVTGHVGPTGDSLSSPIAAVAFSAYVVVLAAAGTRITIRRDIT